MEPAGCQQLSRGAGERREGGKVNKPIKDALSQAEREKERGHQSNSPQACWRLLAALQRDRELAGVFREGRREGGRQGERRGAKGARERSCGGEAQQCWSASSRPSRTA